MEDEHGSGNNEEFMLAEEVYGDEGDEEEMPNTQNTVNDSDWRTVVEEVCNNDQHVDESEDSDGFRSESDLDSLCSEGEEYDGVRRSRRQYNPRSGMDGFKFKLGMEFPSIEDLRNVLREVFIKEDREFKFLANDQNRLRAKCKGNGCK